MVERVAVFIDYENMHRGGHSRFAGVGEPLYETVIDPLRLAKRLVMRRRPESIVCAVHVYRGQPMPQYQREAASANDTLAAAWAVDGVQVWRRPLKYTDNPDGSWTAQEKGIDVALAIGLVEGAINDAFDAAIVFSNDTDQLPALELAFHKTSPRIEIAAWSTSKPIWFPDMLRQNKRLPYCHFVSETDFVECRDYRAADK